MRLNSGFLQWLHVHVGGNKQSLMSRSMNSRILTGQQPVVFLQLKAVEDPLHMLKLLLLLLLQLFLQGSAAFLLLLFLIQRLL